VAHLLCQNEYRPARFLGAFWQTNNIAKTVAAKPCTQTARLRRVQWSTAGLVVIEIAAGVSIIVGSLLSDNDQSYIWPFGAALIVGYPVIVAHVMAFFVFLTRVAQFVAHPRQVGKAILCRMLEAQVVRLRRAHPFKVVAVVGSIGKTSTKLAIAHVLMQSHKVVYQEGNYNDRLTVPLVVFGRTLPGLTNIPAWLRILVGNELKIRRPFAADIAVLELGTDGPGQIKDFAYLQPDVAVVTALTPEHMEFFKTLDAVAAEEMTVTDFSKVVLVNADDSPQKYLKSKKIKTYGTKSKADFRISSIRPDGLQGVRFKLKLGKKNEAFESPMFGQAGAKIAAAAIATAHSLDFKVPAIAKSLQWLPPVPGRMQLLDGKKKSTIIDDTYNASPVPVMAGLDVLASAEASQRIAILGSMNELGDYARQAHEMVGTHCKPRNVDLVITIGRDAKKWLAPKAVQSGCKVKTFMSPYDAGDYALSQLKNGAVVLAEGSQNGVFAEEAIKQMLKNPEDSKRLVRQSPYWMKIKAKQFSR
jgi:UDP-N-acetylmuramoyl-tripeptide--D-alanyl-D-alanine ligase